MFRNFLLPPLISKDYWWTNTNVKESKKLNLQSLHLFQKIEKKTYLTLNKISFVPKWYSTLTVNLLRYKCNTTYQTTWRNVFYAPIMSNYFEFWSSFFKWQLKKKLWKQTSTFLRMYLITFCFEPCHSCQTYLLGKLS